MNNASFPKSPSEGSGGCFDVEWNLDIGDGVKLDIEELFNSGAAFCSGDDVRYARRSSFSDDDEKSAIGTIFKNEILACTKKVDTVPEAMTKYSAVEAPAEPQEVKGRDVDVRKRKDFQITAGPSRRAGRKKPKGTPKRPLSAYNIFFQKERLRVYERYQTSGERVTFEDLGKEIGLRWRLLSDADRKEYDLLAEKEIDRYRKERDAYEECRRRRFDGSSLKDDMKTRVSSTKCINSAQPLMLNESNRSNTYKERIFEVPAGSSIFSATSSMMSFAHPTSFQSLQPSTSAPFVAEPFPTLQVPEFASSTGETLGRNVISAHNGMQVYLPDKNGGESLYTLQYKCFRMTKTEADRYIQGFSQATHTSMLGDAVDLTGSLPNRSHD